MQLRFLKVETLLNNAFKCFQDSQARRKVQENKKRVILPACHLAQILSMITFKLFVE